MGQEETFKFLKKKDQWMTAKEIAGEMKISAESVRIALNKCFKWDEVIKRSLGAENSWRTI